MPPAPGPRSATSDDPPSGRHFTDFDHLAAFFTGWDGRFEQVSSGRFEATLRVARGTIVRAASVELNQTILARGRGAPELVTVYPVAARNAGGLWRGRRLDPGLVVVHGTDAETDHRTARLCESMGLSLPVADLERVARVVKNSDNVQGPRGWNSLTPPPDLYDALDRRLRRLLTSSSRSLAAADGVRLEQDTLRAIVEVVFPEPDQRRVPLPLPARTDLTRRAEGVMRANLGTALGALDLCAELGVSDRTLRLAFRERYGLGPMAYYKALRLNAVRAALRRSHRAAVGVVARGFGFHHLGQFAADYRRLFGESPSETAPAGGVEG